MTRKRLQGNGRPGVYQAGDHYGICDRCGRKHLTSDMRYEWNGLYVCIWDWEPRNQQDFVRGVKDKQSVDDPRSEAPDVFLDTNEISADDL